MHTNFQLDRRGGQIGIFSGTEQIDVHTFGVHTAGVSEGRHPDGVDNWILFNVPAPGGSNLLHPPVIVGTAHSPLLPRSSEPVTVTATITDDGVLLTTTLFYSGTASGFVQVDMVNVRRNLYAARIPPQPDGSLVAYFVVAGDDDGQVSTDPSGAPDRFHETIVGYQPPILLINELMADNETVWGDVDEPGEFPDWIELYNPGPGSVGLGGRYLTDDLDNPTQFRIASGTMISAGGFLVFYADGDPEQGPLHTNFRLSKDGESVGLFDIDAAGNRPLDTYTFGPQPADGSVGRCPDGSVTWMSFTLPTPGAANGPCGRLPVISSLVHTPLNPSASDEVTVTAVLNGGMAVITATLWTSTGGGFVAVPMAPAGRLTGMPVGRGVYSATIPAQSADTRVAYYVQVEDARGLSVTGPLRAPVNTHGYLVGYRPPPVVINEVLADNATRLEDPDESGEFPDWIELYNPGPAPIDLSGKYLTDDLAAPCKFRISDGLVVPAGGFVLFYADDDPEQGPFHTNFKLSRNGESIGLFDVDATGNQPIDMHTFGPQTTDASERRYPNGGDRWITFGTPSPGRADVVGRYLPVRLKPTMH